MANYSNELINRAMQYFKEKHGLTLDRDTASEYLNAYADLYEAFSDLIENKK